MRGKGGGPGARSIGSQKSKHEELGPHGPALGPHGPPDLLHTTKKLVKQTHVFEFYVRYFVYACKNKKCPKVGAVLGDDEFKVGGEPTAFKRKGGNRDLEYTGAETDA